jgi:hypothetical protein
LHRRIIQQMASDFTAALKEEFLVALQNEADAQDAAVKADEAYVKARNYRVLTQNLLVTKGIDPQSLKPPKSTSPEGIEQFGLVPDSSTNGALPEKPLHATHLVYLLIRKHGNTGYTPKELEQLAADMGYELPASEVTKIYWKQSGAKRMERGPGWKIKLTQDGEKFTKFRVQKAGDEYKPMIQHFPTEVIK